MRNLSHINNRSVKSAVLKNVYTSKQIHGFFFATFSGATSLKFEYNHIRLEFMLCFL